MQLRQEKWSASSLLPSFLSSCCFYTYRCGAVGIEGRKKDQENLYWTALALSRFHALSLEVVWRGLSPLCVLLGFLKPSSAFSTSPSIYQWGSLTYSSSLVWPLRPSVAFQKLGLELQQFSPWVAPYDCGEWGSSSRKVIKPYTI